MLRKIQKLLILFTLFFLLPGCSSPAVLPTETQIKTTIAMQTLEAAETSQAATATEPANLPAVVEYNLGDTTITQSTFPEDSRFRNMPVRLNGIIAVPDGNGGPYPVVIILHGNHPGCPVPEGDTVDRWPCDLELERPNYRGFDYLVSQLAAHGYVALSINVNAENTFGFGEPVPIERLGQLVDLHLKNLSTASSGGENKFGVELQGRTDLKQLAFIGHSQGGEGAYWLTQKETLDAPDAYSRLGYGPVYGLLLVAPSANFGGAKAARVPMAVLLPACDNDVFQQDGQLFYEITRIDPKQSTWASSVWLESANHNYFNGTLSDEAVTRPGRPDCEPLLKPEVQRDFLSAYTIDFLAQIFHNNEDAKARLGMNFQAQAPSELYGLPARVTSLAPGGDRLPLLVPTSSAELETNLAGGSITAKGVTTFFCEEGYFTPSVKPGSEPCKRVNLVIPGNPAMVVASWSQTSAALHFSIPEGSNLSQFSTISLRAALDPLSPLNKAGAAQVFTIQMVDSNGNSSTVHTRSDEPALQFPHGEIEENDTFEGGWFTGRVPLTSIRIPFNDFVGVNFTEVRQIIILFDQTPSGSLFMSDLELVR
jgi:hypothetical protein